MTATNQDIKDFFALAGHTVTNSHLTRLATWLQVQEGFETTPDATDLVNTIYRTIRQQVIDHERDLIEEAIIEPTW